jgi:hypothetical protein
MMKIGGVRNEQGFVCRRKYFEINALDDFEPREI